MKFMTPASVRNLPSYLAEDRQKRLLDRAEEESKRVLDERKLMVEMGNALDDLTMKAKTPEEYQAGMAVIKKSFTEKGMTPEMMQMTANAFTQFKTEHKQKETENKAKLLEAQTLADNTNFMNAIRNPGKVGDPSGYEAPAESDAFAAGISGRSPELLLSLLKYREGQEDRAEDKETRLLSRDKTLAEIEKLRKETEFIGADKKRTLNEVKYIEEQAQKSLAAKIKSFGGQFDPESGIALIPSDEEGNPNPQALIALDRSGFKFDAGGEVQKVSQGLLKGNKYYIPVYIGDFSESRMNNSDYSMNDGDLSEPVQAKDGKWYVNKDGQWYLVEQDEEAPQSPEDQDGTQSANRTPAKETQTRDNPNRGGALGPASDAYQALRTGLKPVGDNIDSWIKKVQR